jgi:G3E family GTPase
MGLSRLRGSRLAAPTGHPISKNFYRPMLNPLLRYSEIQSAQGVKLLPVTLVAGFLGAGKTTLLNALLRQAGSRRLAVLVNDFGALNIDARLIVKVEGQRMELANGCICCSIRDDLVAGISALLDSEPVPDQIVIETSGVSDPQNIVCTLNTSPVRRRMFLENIVTVVDAVNAEENQQPETRALWERQIQCAYMVVLNRTAAAGDARVARVRGAIASLAPGVSVVETDSGELPISVLLGEQQAATSAFRPAPSFDATSHPFSSMVYRCEAPIRRTDFQKFMKDQSSRVYRAKGFINFRNYPRATLYQKVGGFESCVDGGAWNPARPQTELVLIGLSDGFDESALRAGLDACSA